MFVGITMYIHVANLSFDHVPDFTQKKKCHVFERQQQKCYEARPEDIIPFR